MRFLLPLLLCGATFAETNVSVPVIGMLNYIHATADPLQRVKAVGVKIVSEGHVPAQFSPTIRNIFIEDPDGFKIELFEQKN